MGGPKKKHSTAATEAKVSAHIMWNHYNPVSFQATRENEVLEDNCSKGAPTEYDRIRSS